jgi:hypothetical protein
MRFNAAFLISEANKVYQPIKENGAEINTLTHIFFEILNSLNNKTANYSQIFVKRVDQ